MEGFRCIKNQGLFAKLSINEHDDPRNAYVNTDTVMFQRRYDVIKTIKTAITTLNTILKILAKVMINILTWVGGEYLCSR